MLTLSHLDDDYYVKMEQRFWAKVEVGHPLGCWQWTAAVSSTGYGNFGVYPGNEASHRVAWMLLIGDIPEGLATDHLCRNRLCVNPDHLEIVTHRTNIQRGRNPQMRSYRDGICMKGLHKMEGDNLAPISGGKKHTCRACRDKWRREYRERTGK